MQPATRPARGVEDTSFEMTVCCSSRINDNIQTPVISNPATPGEKSASPRRRNKKQISPCDRNDIDGGHFTLNRNRRLVVRRQTQGQTRSPHPACRSGLSISERRAKYRVLCFCNTEADSYRRQSDCASRKHVAVDFHRNFPE